MLEPDVVVGGACLLLAPLLHLDGVCRVADAEAAAHHAEEHEDWERERGRGGMGRVTVRMRE
jgi:NADPH-dependent 2,4-dienoyl-CoA reductase/sulfur reductase-like enzyme